MESKAVCLYEDRASEENGVRLLISSLVRHNPNIDIYAFLPGASAGLLEWLSRFERVRNLTNSIHVTAGWNVKPVVLEKVLEHVEATLWIDSDIIVTGPIPDNYFDGETKTILVAEEARWARDRIDGGRRARDWKLPVQRLLDTSVNTGVIGVNRHHRELLAAWQRLLQDETYLAAQRSGFHERPYYLVGDQDVLTVLLSTHPYSSVPIRLLRLGEEITQFFGLFGFTARERLRFLSGRKPVFIHSQGPKPWGGMPPTRSFKKKLIHYVDYIYRDTSPYVLMAKQYKSECSGDTMWMAPKTTLGAGLRFLGFGSIPLTGFPMAVLGDVLRYTKSALKKPRS